MLEVQKFSLFQRYGMDSGQSQWWMVCSSKRDPWGISSTKYLKSAEYIVVHSKGEPGIEAIYGWIKLYHDDRQSPACSSKLYKDFPPDRLAARVTNWTRRTDVCDFRYRSSRRPHPDEDDKWTFHPASQHSWINGFCTAYGRWTLVHEGQNWIIEQATTAAKLHFLVTELLTKQKLNSPLLPPGINSCTVKGEGLFLDATVWRWWWGN